MAFTLFTPLQTYAEEEQTAITLNVNVNLGEDTQETFIVKGTQVFADLQFIAHATRCDLSHDGDVFFLVHGSRTIEIDISKGTLTEDAGKTTDKASIETIKTDGTIFVPAYALLTYLGATCTMDKATKTVLVDMPEVTFYEVYPVDSSVMSVGQFSSTGTKLFLDNLVDFINIAGGNSIREILSGAYKKDVIYAALEAETLAYTSVKDLCGERMETLYEKWAISGGVLIAQSFYDLGIFLDNERIRRIASLNDPADRMASYITYFDNDAITSKMRSFEGYVDFADEAFLALEILNTVNERTKADVIAIDALQSNISSSTLKMAGNPTISEEYTKNAKEVSATLSYPTNTFIVTAVEKGADFVVDKVLEGAIEKTAGGPLALSIDLGLLITNVVGYSAIGKYTPFAQVPKSDNERTAIIATEYFNQTAKVTAGLAEKYYQTEGAHDQEALNAFYYSYLLQLRYAFVYDESMRNYFEYYLFHEKYAPYYDDQANSLAYYIYYLENCSVQAIPVYADLNKQGKTFDKTIRNLVDPSVTNASVGETLEFGTYNGDPIEWRVLAVEEGRALLITEKVIMSTNYHDTSTEQYTYWGDFFANTTEFNALEETTWETSTLRYYLNGDFLSGFTAEEQALIQTTELHTEDNPVYGTWGGNNTLDKVFCLSCREAEYYFMSDSDRKAKYGGKIAIWYLRNPGESFGQVCSVAENGAIEYGEVDVRYEPIVVNCVSFLGTMGARPAMWVDTSVLYSVGD
jgi:hypothetical protein